MNRGIADGAAIRETGYAPEELSEGKLIAMKEESGCDESCEDVPEEVMLTKNFIWKEILEISRDIERAKDEMVEAHPNLERSMYEKIHQGTERMFAQ